MAESFYSLSREDQQEIREELDHQDVTAHELGFPQSSIEDYEWVTDDEPEQP